MVRRVIPTPRSLEKAKRSIREQKHLFTLTHLCKDCRQTRISCARAIETELKTGTLIEFQAPSDVIYGTISKLELTYMGDKHRLLSDKIVQTLDRNLRPKNFV